MPAKPKPPPTAVRRRRSRARRRQPAEPREPPDPPPPPPPRPPPPPIRRPRRHSRHPRRRPPAADHGVDHELDAARAAVPRRRHGAAACSARVFDPLWMLTRQWQVGEFQAEDAGTPVQARVRATSALLSRCHLGRVAARHAALAGAALRSACGMPLEVHRRAAAHARRRSRTTRACSRFAVEAGLHFLRMLELQPLSKSYRAAFIAQFALQPLRRRRGDAADDEATSRFVQSMAGRAPDARRLAAAVPRRHGAAQLVARPGLEIAAGDRAEVQQAARAWLAWYDARVQRAARRGRRCLDCRRGWNTRCRSRRASRPARATSHAVGDRVRRRPPRLEQLRPATAKSTWAPTATDASATIIETTVPAPVDFRGAPAPRFWEMEDARIAYGLVPVGPPTWRS